MRGDGRGRTCLDRRHTEHSRPNSMFEYVVLSPMLPGRAGMGWKGCAVLARQRQAMILDEVKKTGAVRVSDLVDRLGVSDMTVRRDLEVLARRGLVEKVYGGATAVVGRSTD